MAEAHMPDMDEVQRQKGPGLKTIAVIAGFFVIEAIVIGATYWLSGSPADVTAETTTKNIQAWQSALVEEMVVEDRFTNSSRGPTYLYECEIWIKVQRKHQNQVKDRLKSMQAQIRADVATIFKRAQPEHLSEPTYGTIKRQIKKALDEHLGHDEEDGKPIVENVLITKCIPSRLEL